MKLHVQSYFIRVHREIHTSTLAIASGIQMEKKFFRKQADFHIPIQSHLQNYHTQITFSTKTYLPLLVSSEA